MSVTAAREQRLSTWCWSFRTWKLSSSCASGETEVWGDGVTLKSLGLQTWASHPPAQLRLPQGHLCCASHTIWLFSNMVSCDEARIHNTLNKSLVLGLEVKSLLTTSLLYAFFQYLALRQMCVFVVEELNVIMNL